MSNLDIYSSHFMDFFQENITVLRQSVNLYEFLSLIFTKQQTPNNKGA
jgi:hypothetical protein